MRIAEVVGNPHILLVEPVIPGFVGTDEQFADRRGSKA
jgi:hypothetical protein